MEATAPFNEGCKRYGANVLSGLRPDQTGGHWKPRGRAGMMLDIRDTFNTYPPPRTQKSIYKPGPSHPFQIISLLDNH